jgi:hypothetical protein
VQSTLDEIQNRNFRKRDKNVKISWQTTTITTTKFPPWEECPPIVALVMTTCVPLLCFPSLVPGLQNTTTFFVSPTQESPLFPTFFFLLLLLLFFLFLASCFYEARLHRHDYENALLGIVK